MSVGELNHLKTQEFYMLQENQKWSVSASIFDKVI